MINDSKRIDAMSFFDNVEITSQQTCGLMILTGKHSFQMLISRDSLWCLPYVKVTSHHFNKRKKKQKEKKNNNWKKKEKDNNNNLPGKDIKS